MLAATFAAAENQAPSCPFRRKASATALSPASSPSGHWRLCRHNRRQPAVGGNDHEHRQLVRKRARPERAVTTRRPSRRRYCRARTSWRVGGPVRRRPARRGDHPGPFSGATGRFTAMLLATPHGTVRSRPFSRPVTARTARRPPPSAVHGKVLVRIQSADPVPDIPEPVGLAEIRPASGQRLSWPRKAPAG